MEKSNHYNENLPYGDQNQEISGYNDEDNPSLSSIEELYNKGDYNYYPDTSF